MRETLPELLAETALLVAYLVGAAGAGTVGALAEYRSYLHLLAGEYRMAGYLAVVGCVALGFAYLLVRDRLSSAITLWADG